MWTDGACPLTRHAWYRHISICCLKLTKEHVPVGLVSNGVHVRRHFVTLLPLVHLNDLLCVDGQPFVRVDNHTEQARVGLGKGKGRYK